MANIEWALCERIVVLRHAKQNPTDREWDAYVAALGMQVQKFAGRLVLLVWTDGGGPTPSQRARVNDTVGDELGLPVAVVSTSMGVRFIVSSLALFNRGIRAFAPNETDAAFAHLALTADEQQQVRRALAALDAKITR